MTRISYNVGDVVAFTEPTPNNTMAVWMTSGFRTGVITHLPEVHSDCRGDIRVDLHDVRHLFHRLFVHVPQLAQVTVLLEAHNVNQAAGQGIDPGKLTTVGKLLSDHALVAFKNKSQ